MKKSKNEEIRRELLTLCADLHVRETGEGEAPSRTIVGRAILFNTPSRPLWSDENEEAVEVIAPEAITREVLDACDIKFTMFHNRQLILARSKQGKGTLTYNVDEKGVTFEFEAPNTADGDKALELVRRGDLAGCSFMFSTHYWDEGFVSRSVEIRDGKSYITYTVKAVTGIYDFTLAADPYYDGTEVDAREFNTELREAAKPEEPKPEEPKPDIAKIKEQLREMRRAANDKIFV
ncbi:MAG: HK97 family phage prohead protease [Bacteroidales bacterium]|nr:HK97 family phage prohead protease [Bacteroidales bacterium]